MLVLKGMNIFCLFQIYLALFLATFKNNFRACILPWKASMRHPDRRGSHHPRRKHRIQLLSIYLEQNTTTSLLLKVTEVPSDLL